MSGVAVGVTVVGALAGASQGRKGRKAAAAAARLQAEAAARSEAEMRRQFEIGQTNMAPWLRAGKGALEEQNALMGMGGDTAGAMNAFQRSPGYTSRLAQGQASMEGGLAARGGMGSGKSLVAGQRYGQDYASNEYGNRLQQVSQVSNQGLSAGTGMANMGNQNANNLSNLWTGNANAQGAAGMAGFNAGQQGLYGGIGLGLAGASAYQQYKANNPNNPNQSSLGWQTDYSMPGTYSGRK